MKGPALDVSINDIMGVVQKLLNAFKQLMAWLGILVLPEEDGSDGYVYPNETRPDVAEIAEGA